MSSSTSRPSRKSQRFQKHPVAKRSQQKVLAKGLPVAEQKGPVAATSPTSTFPILGTMSDSSSPASVLRVKFRKWQKLADDYPRSVSCEVLGKSMKDEEAEWRKAHPQIEGQPEDKDEGKYEGKGKGRGDV